MKLLTNRQQEEYDKAKICYISGEMFEYKYATNKIYHKVRDHCHYKGGYGGPAHSICNLKCGIHKKITITFHIGSNYDYHFIFNFIFKELAEEFEGKFTCLKENTEKPNKQLNFNRKEVKRIGKNWGRNYKNTILQIKSYINNVSKFLDTYCNTIMKSTITLKKFMKLNVNKDIKIKNENCVESHTKILSAAFNTQTSKVIQQYTNVCVVIEITKTKFDENLKKRLANMYKFYSQAINKLILLL